MNVLNWAFVVTLGAALSASGALAQQHDMPMHGQQPTADQDMMAGMARMNHDMGNAPMSGDPDRDFVAMMIPHHQGAIDMAEVELRHGKDPAMRRLATAIVAAQHREIAQMRRWQAAHVSAVTK